MSYEQYFIRRTPLCEDSRKSITIVKEELIFLANKCTWLSSEMGKEFRHVDHDDFDSLLANAKAELASMEAEYDPNDYDFLKMKMLVMDLEKVDKETDWNTSSLIYEAG